MHRLAGGFEGDQEAYTINTQINAFSNQIFSMA
jgi:hypothetical protein